jgi:hypothetical protein
MFSQEWVSVAAAGDQRRARFQAPVIHAGADVMQDGWRQRPKEAISMQRLCQRAQLLGRPAAGRA